MRKLWLYSSRMQRAQSKTGKGRTMGDEAERLSVLEHRVRNQEQLIRMLQRKISIMDRRQEDLAHLTVAIGKNTVKVKEGQLLTTEK